MAQNSTGLVLFAAEERGKAHFGEPCSWWQTEDLHLLAELGATRGAFFTCELDQKWTKQRCDKPGSFGFVANFKAKASEVKEGWPQLEGPEQTYMGPLSKHCGCGHKHESLGKTKATTEKNQPISMCSLPAVIAATPRGKGNVKHGNVARQCYTSVLSSLRPRQSRAFLDVTAAVAPSTLEGLAGFRFKFVQGEVGGCGQGRNRGRKSKRRERRQGDLRFLRWKSKKASMVFWKGARRGCECWIRRVRNESMQKLPIGGKAR